MNIGALSRNVVEHQAIRFLLCGCFAAAVNWLSRIGLSLVLPLNAAVLLAYVIGMSTGFLLYRNYVFQCPVTRIWSQVIRFLAVNCLAAGVVVSLTQLFLWLQAAATYPPPAREAIAHGLAICAGAVLNYYGHRTLTFRRAVVTAIDTPTVHGMGGRHGI